MLIRAKTLFRIGGDLKRPGETVEVDEETGRRLIAVGAAVEASVLPPDLPSDGPLTSNPNGNTPEGGNAPETPKTGKNGNTDLEAMSFADLKAMAQEIGIDTGKIRSKAGMIDAITAAQMDSGDDFPELTAQDVVDE